MEDITHLKSITIYSEMTPNPNTMKFVTDMILLESGINIDIDNKEDAEYQSELASQLFNFPFVKNVFISNNIITITKSIDIEWEFISIELRQYLSDKIKAGINIINNNYYADLQNINESINIDKEKDKDFGIQKHTINYDNLNELEKKIVSVIEEYIQPAVLNDGGAIYFEKLENNIVFVKLYGSCSGCPSSTVTLKKGVEYLLKEKVDENLVVEEIF